MSDAIRREQNLPAELAADPTFMAVREAARYRMTGAELELFDAALALAYSHGVIAGGKRMVDAVRAAVASPTNVVSFR